MIAKLLAVLGLASLALAAHADEAGVTNRIVLPKAGYSIEPLDVAPGVFAQQSLMMSLPLADHFTPNVNVQIQPFKGTIEDYAKSTLEQFKEHKINVIAQKQTGSILTLEYAGEVSGRAMHWYGRAEQSGQHIYLTTATTTENLWTNQAVKLKGCVDSFRCLEHKPAATPKAAPPQ